MRKFLCALSFIVPLLNFGGVNSAASSAQTNENRLHCVSNEGSWVNPSCGRGELLVKAHNNCGEKVDIKICILRDNGTWSCGWDTRDVGTRMTL